MFTTRTSGARTPEGSRDVERVAMFPVGPFGIEPNPPLLQRGAQTIYARDPRADSSSRAVEREAGWPDHDAPTGMVRAVGTMHGLSENNASEYAPHRADAPLPTRHGVRRSHVAIAIETSLKCERIHNQYRLNRPAAADPIIGATAPASDPIHSSDRVGP